MRIDDRIFQVKLFSRVCSKCRHFQRLDLKKDRASLGPSDLLTVQRCSAFPDGIPDEIWLEKNPHTSPFPGDGGIMFEVSEDFALKSQSERQGA